MQSSSSIKSTIRPTPEEVAAFKLCPPGENSDLLEAEAHCMEIREKYGRRLALLSQLSQMLHGATIDFEAHTDQPPWIVAGFDFYRARSPKAVVVQFVCDRLSALGFFLEPNSADTHMIELPIVEKSAHELMRVENSLQNGSFSGEDV